MTPQQVRHKIDSDPDFIWSKRFDFSLKKLLERYPNGAPQHVIESALQMSSEEIEDTYDGIIDKLRLALNVNP